jgi:uncharacterized protein YyaL (SSP411 family)
MHPGFFREPKFLMTEILFFLLDSWRIEGNREMESVLLKTLRTMGSSAVFDTVEGGFFRYATKRDWSTPHYEKLLADNAEMLSVYSSAYELTRDEFFGGVAEKTLKFLYRRLRDRGSGFFFSSQDADEEYYLKDAEGRLILLAPSIDETVISEYNGRAISGLVSAYRASPGEWESPTGKGKKLLTDAEDLGEALREKLWSGEDGQIRFREGDSAGMGHLADGIAVAVGYLDLFEAGGKEKFLGWAGEILDWSVRRFFSPGAFGFLDRKPGPADKGALNMPLVPFSLNARAACALMRYARHASRSDLFAVAELTLKGLSAEFGGKAAFGAPYGSALLHHGKLKGGASCLPGDPSCSEGGAGASSTGFQAG